MAAISAGHSDSAAPGSAVRRLLSTAAVATVAFGIVQYVSSRNDEDPAVRSAWLQDASAIMVLALIATVIAAVVVRQTALSSATAQKRGTLGLAIGAIIATPLFWYSAAPIILVAGAAYLGNATGVMARDGGSTGIRATVIVAAMLVFASVAIVVGGTIAEMV